MMDPAFFVGRRAILEWLNTTFQTNLSKIEETCSGAAAAQILDAIYPGEVMMQKVRWDGKSPHEYIDNYKVIQAVFEKKGVDKYVDVQKLIRGRHQDNLENMQWFKVREWLRVPQHVKPTLSPPPPPPRALSPLRLFASRVEFFRTQLRGAAVRPTRKARER